LLARGRDYTGNRPVITIGDLASLLFLMSAPCPHCEQINTRGSDAAVAAPMCAQLGQMIRVSMSVTTAAAGASATGQALRSNSGSLAMFTAMRRASSRVSSLADARHYVSCSQET
jgi:hypothetical protein